MNSEKISRRLFISVLIIMLSLLCIAVPLIVSQYQHYKKAQRALIEIESLKAVADLANSISRERGPANMAMSSTLQELAHNQKELQLFRNGVDQQIRQTFAILANTGFINVDQQAEAELIEHLEISRQYVDIYIQTPIEQRSAAQFDNAILHMFSAWESSYDILKTVVKRSVNKDSGVSDYYTLIIILADLRDQAGRLASNVMAHVSFKEALPSENIARSLQTEKQVNYLWDLLQTIQPEKYKTKEFIRLHHELKSRFIDAGIPIVLKLIWESQNQRPYSLEGTELTMAISDKFSAVTDFQKYLLEYSVEVAQANQQSAKNIFVVTTCMSLVSLFFAMFSMVFAQCRLFAPLIEARNMIVNLSFSHAKERGDSLEHQHDYEQSYSLHDALEKLKSMLKQRDAFEFELKNMASTDSLTGLHNRLALNNYLNSSNTQPQHFQQLCLIIVDIDNFKCVNDQYGHIFGDQVIVSVAQCLKAKVRSSDLIVRFGGDEFLIVLHNIDLQHAMNSAEKIRDAVSKLDFYSVDSGQKIKVSVSLGVAVGAENWLELLAQADHSLFKAKAKGKNTVQG